MMPPPACAAPLVGDLLINEVLIDADDESRGEFIEVLNQSDLSVNLDRIELLYQAPSGSLETKITFEPGCMAPHSAMVIYNNTRRAVLVLVHTNCRQSSAWERSLNLWPSQ